MTDFIERDAAEKALDEACRYYPTSFYNGISVSADVIHKLPAADVRPVVRGRWVVKGQDVFCSACEAESAYNEWGASHWSKYCPHCGADMREDEG